MAHKKELNSTCITNKTELNETKATEVIHTSINSKHMNIVRVQKEQGTKSRTKPLQYHRCCSNVVLASSQPPVLALILNKNFPLPLKIKNSYQMDM